jgi:hypothetical protein
MGVMEMRYEEEEEEERWPYWPTELLNSDFEQFLVQSLVAQLQVHPSATLWVTGLTMSITRTMPFISLYLHSNTNVEPILVYAQQLYAND